jgi:uncharacterized protein with HEPN domain
MGADDRDAALLADMLQYAEEAASLVEGIGYEAYALERMRILALERALEIVGEAAAHISQPTKDGMREIPWKLLQGQRNVLSHMYGKIDQFQLFKTASEDAPRLIALLRRRSG